MLAVTNRVQAALNFCDAWQLRLDKLSFERGGDATAKTASLKAVRACYNEHTILQLGAVCDSRQRLLRALKRQHAHRCAVVKLVAESRLLLHLGRASVLENVGVYADRTYAWWQGRLGRGRRILPEWSHAKFITP